MKIRVTMKSPDALSDAISNAVERKRLIAENDGLEEYFDGADVRDDMYDVCSAWFQCGEYLTVDIDTETGEAVVVPAN